MKNHKILKAVIIGAILVIAPYLTAAVYLQVHYGNIKNMGSDVQRHMLWDSQKPALILNAAGVGFTNAVAVLDPNSTVTTVAGRWAQSTGTGWTFALAGNSRDASSSVVQLVTDTGASDVGTLTLASTYDLRKYDYIGMWMDAASAVGATEFTITLANAAGTAITNCTALVLPALTATDEMFVQWDISTCSRASVKYFRVNAGAAPAAETIDLGPLLAFKLSNGYGPVQGSVADMAVASGTVTQGEFVCYQTLATAAYVEGVYTCPANGYNAVGIALTTGRYASGAHVLVQTGGLVVRPAAGAVADNAAVAVQTGGVNVDDGGTASDYIGYAVEAAADADEQIYVWLNRK